MYELTLVVIMTLQFIPERIPFVSVYFTYFVLEHRALAVLHFAGTSCALVLSNWLLPLSGCHQCAVLGCGSVEQVGIHFSLPLPSTWTQVIYDTVSSPENNYSNA